MTSAGTAMGAGPLAWWVLALLMGIGAVGAATLSWREHRAMRSRSGSLAGEGRERARPAIRMRRPSAAECRVGGRRPGGGWPVRTLRTPDRRRVRELGSAVGTALLVGLLLDTPAGWPAGAAAGWAAWYWQRRRAPRRAADAAAQAERASVERQLPLVADLLAACLTAGSAPAPAAEAVGRSTGGPLGERLVRAAAELRLGAEPGAVWARFGEMRGCEGLARCMERAGTAGVPPVQAVARLAAECRAARARAATARARRASVLVTGPLGLCFLPAFLAVGVAPVVVGLARSLL